MGYFVNIGLSFIIKGVAAVATLPYAPERYFLTIQLNKLPPPRAYYTASRITQKFLYFSEHITFINIIICWNLMVHR